MSPKSIVFYFKPVKIQSKSKLGIMPSIDSHNNFHINFVCGFFIPDPSFLEKLLKVLSESINRHQRQVVGLEDVQISDEDCLNSHEMIFTLSFAFNESVVLWDKFTEVVSRVIFIELTLFFGHPFLTFFKGLIFIFGEIFFIERVFRLIVIIVFVVFLVFFIVLISIRRFLGFCRFFGFFNVFGFWFFGIFCVRFFILGARVFMLLLSLFLSWLLIIGLVIGLGHFCWKEVILRWNYQREL